MEKIKSILHPHGSNKDRETAGDVTHDHKGTTGTAAQSSTGTAGTASGATTAQSPPIYNQMTGHSQAPSTTGENTTIGAGTGIGGEGNGVQRPHVSSGTYDGNSEASIKSGVIGFTPGQAGQAHAALPDNNPVEDKLHRDHIVGEGIAGTNTNSGSSGLRNELSQDQPSVLPVASGIGHSSGSTQQPLDSTRATGTDRSFPLSGGVTSGQQGSSTLGTHGTSGTSGLNTSEREPHVGDRHGREGLAEAAAAAAAGTAAAVHGHHNDNRNTQADTLDQHAVSPTRHTHLTSSVPEHNIHPDALHAAGVRPLKDSDHPSHGAPYEAPHVNTGTLLDYEKAYGSDPHTKHTGLLDYRPHVHRSGTSPHIPGEFPGATPETERSGPILGGTDSTLGTAATNPSTTHDLRHTGSLDDPAPKSSTHPDHHLGRDAAIAGGVGAAGLGAAAHHKHETPTSGTGNLYDEKNPYSSKALDPRVVGGDSRLNEQRFDPSTSTAHPLSGSSASRVPPTSDESQHHYGRDAAIGGGALGAGALAASALSGDKHHGTNLQDSSSLPTTQHTTGVTNPSAVGTTSTTHQLPSSSTATSALQKPTGTYGEPQSQHHYGRDAGLAGAGAAAAGGLAHHESRDQPSGQHIVGSTAEDPASKTVGPHKSNIANVLDPRVQPDPAKQKDHTTTGPHQSDTLNRLDPKVDDKAGQHHYGRDAAIAGGAGAAGYGAYEAAKSYGDHRSVQPGAALQEQRYDPTAPGAHAPVPVPATSEYNYHNPDVAALASATGTGSANPHSAPVGQTQQPYTTAQLAQAASSQPPQAYKDPRIDSRDLGPQDSSSRNAALGAGAGLAGASAVGYGLAHHGDKNQLTSTPGTSTQPGSSSLPQPTGSLTQGQQYPHNTDPSQSHLGRNAALAGGAGAAAGAGAGYAYGQHAQPQFDPKEQERLEKETAKRQHELEKKHDKDVHKLEKEHEKDLKKHEKEAAKHDEDEKKKGGVLGFLHRDKSKKGRSPESTPRRSDEHYGRDAAVAGGVGAGAAGLAEHERDDKFGHGSGYKGKNLLHKEPPKGHPAREARSSGSSRSSGEHHYGRDAAIGGGALGAGALGAHELSKDRTEPSTYSSSTGAAPGARETLRPGYHEAGLTGNQSSVLPDRTREQHHYGRDAAVGGTALGAGGLAAHELHGRQTDPYATNVGHSGTGLTGTHQAAIPGNTTSSSVLGNRTQHVPGEQGFVSGKREHIGIDGPIGDPNMISGDRETSAGVYGAHPVSDLAKDHTVIEPRTGLPMNVGRYGDGAGGTDGGPIGHHQHESVPGKVLPGTADLEHSTTDWADVKKKDTIY